MTEQRMRARELGIRIGRLQPGQYNAITDVPGVKVGHATIISWRRDLVVGEGPVRTGVTVIWPHSTVPSPRIRSTPAITSSTATAR